VKQWFSLAVLSLNFLFINAQLLSVNKYEIAVSLPDSMNNIEIMADVFLQVDNGKADSVKIDLCKDFVGVGCKISSVFLEEKKVEYFLENDEQLSIVPEKPLAAENLYKLTISYTLFKKEDYLKYQYSDFAFQANADMAHINAAITRADNWFPKLRGEHIKRLPPFDLQIKVKKEYEVMASGKLMKIVEDGSYKTFFYSSYKEITDRSLYFFINKNKPFLARYDNGFCIRMMVPADTLKGNTKILSDIAFKSYRFFESVYGETNLNEYKLNSFVNESMGYSGLFNSCNIPERLFVSPVILNELYIPLRDFIHEISHTWWGNIVSSDPKMNYWMFEGFAKFSEPFFLKTILGKEIEMLYRKRIRLVVASNADFIPPLRFDASSISDQGIKNDAAYHQGALFLLTLKEMMGERDFINGMKEYVNLNRGKITHPDNFFKAMQNNTSIDLHDFFYDFLDKPGFAEFTGKTENLGKQGGQFKYRITISNTGNKYLFTNMLLNNYKKTDTVIVSIPAGQSKTFEVFSKDTLSTPLFIVDPDEVFMVRNQGLRSPGAKLYTDANGKLRVTGIVENSPFYKTGIKNNDVIESIDGQDLTKNDVYAQHRFIHRQEGTTMKVTVMNNENKPIEHSLVY